MEKRRLYANCWLVGNYVAERTSYKQGSNSPGYTPDEDDMRQMDEREFYNKLDNQKRLKMLLL